MTKCRYCESPKVGFVVRFLFNEKFEGPPFANTAEAVQYAYTRGFKRGTIFQASACLDCQALQYQRELPWDSLYWYPTGQSINQAQWRNSNPKGS